jgi:hypothetical protein
MADCTKQTAKVFNKGKVERGLAFPTCISVNQLAGHVSPLGDSPAALMVGDVVKVDVAVHVDGYIAAVAQTTVLTGQPGTPCTGRAADVVCAAHLGAEVGPSTHTHTHTFTHPHTHMDTHIRTHTHTHARTHSCRLETTPRPAVSLSPRRACGGSVCMRLIVADGD